MTEPTPSTPPDAPSLPEVLEVTLLPPVETRTLPRFDRPLQVGVREARLLTQAPWVRPVGRLTMNVSTQGWRFPPPGEALAPPAPRLARPEEEPEPGLVIEEEPAERRPTTRLRPPSDAVLFKDRLLYLLQPPLEDLFAGKQVQLPFPPYPYQVQGIAFLMPRHAALLADEMGLGKTAQVIMALRLLFHAGRHPACPGRLPQAAGHQLDARAAPLGGGRARSRSIGGDTEAREAAWFVSKCPLKLVNYELLTRDAEFARRRAAPLRRGRARRGPAHQEPRLEDGPGGAQHPPRAAAGP